jgi:hypothetical protein
VHASLVLSVNVTRVDPGEPDAFALESAFGACVAQTFGAHARFDECDFALAAPLGIDLPSGMSQPKASLILQIGRDNMCEIIDMRETPARERDSLTSEGTDE